MNKIDAIIGALVADAACMGTHWLYDQAHIKNLESTGDLVFREPDPVHYENQKAYFAHAARSAGELSHYGESARLAAEVALEAGYTTDAHRQAFLDSFGPCGSYVGYADRPTKALIARILTEGDALTDPSGSDDDQMPVFCVVPGLFASDCAIDTIELATEVLSTHPVAKEGTCVVFDCLQRLHSGASLQDALIASTAMAEGELREKLEQSLCIDSYQPLEVAQQFGLPCHIPQGLPVCWHLLKYAQDFKSCIRDNIRCGGDTCGRAMALGAIAGLAFGVPVEWQARTTPGVLSVTVNSL